MRDTDMNVLILEDKESSKNTLKKIVLSCSGVDNVFCYSRKEEAFVCAMENTIDLFLLDIVLEPDVVNDNSGIFFAESIRKIDTYRLTPIIFITVLMGLERELLKKIHCYDYIEKPIGDGRLVKEHVEEVLEAISLGRKDVPREYIPLHHDGIGYLIFLDDVIYFENKRGILYIHTVDDDIQIPNLPAKKLLQRIERSEFLMPVYGTAVNVRYISSVDFRNREVYLKNNCVIPIGGRKYRQFKKDYLKWKENASKF